MIETSLNVYDYPDLTEAEEIDLIEQEKFDMYVAEIAYEEKRLEELLNGNNS